MDVKSIEYLDKVHDTLDKIFLYNLYTIIHHLPTFLFLIMGTTGTDHYNNIILQIYLIKS